MVKEDLLLSLFYCHKLRIYSLLIKGGENAIWEMPPGALWTFSFSGTLKTKRSNFLRLTVEFFTLKTAIDKTISEQGPFRGTSGAFDYITCCFPKSKMNIQSQLLSEQTKKKKSLKTLTFTIPLSSLPKTQTSLRFTVFASSVGIRLALPRATKPY